MKSNDNSHQIMAVFFCLFPFSFCAYPANNQQMIINYQQNHNTNNNFDFRRGAALSNNQIVSVSKPNVSPCPRVFRYLFDGEEWEGRLQIEKPAPRGLPSFLKVEMSVGFKYNSVSCSKKRFKIILIEFLFFRNM